MPCVIRRLRFGDGSMRLGPKCFKWGDHFTRSLVFEIIRVNVAVIGGLKGKPSRQEYRWIEAALIDAGLRGAMDRVVKDKNGKPKLDKDGNVITRFVMLPMPALRRRKQPASPKGCPPQHS